MSPWRTEAAILWVSTPSCSELVMMWWFITWDPDLYKVFLSKIKNSYLWWVLYFSLWISRLANNKGHSWSFGYRVYVALENITSHQNVLFLQKPFKLNSSKPCISAHISHANTKFCCIISSPNHKRLGGKLIYLASHPQWLNELGFYSSFLLSTWPLPFQFVFFNLNGCNALGPKGKALLCSHTVLNNLSLFIHFKISSFHVHVGG